MVNDRDALKERVRARLPAGETVVAQGTAAERRTLGDESSVPETYLVLTDQRLLLTRMSRSLPADEEISLGTIARWGDGLQYHRYFIAIAHPPFARREHVRSLVPFMRANREVTRTETILRFSNRNTAVAKALRADLTAREIPHDALALPELTREERTRGSRVLMHGIDAKDVPRRIASRINDRRE